MKHLTAIHRHLELAAPKRLWLETRAAGRFYTHRLIGAHLVAAWLANESAWLDHADGVVIADPFGGDGRLIFWAIEAVCARHPKLTNWEVHLWDIHEAALEQATARLHELAQQKQINVALNLRVTDAFKFGPAYEGKFDAVLTNPPWELLKPDIRELRHLPKNARDEYVSGLREFDKFLASTYRKSQPRRKFSGWGTNLARAGTELALRLVRPERLAAIVSPASLFADESSAELRKWLFTENELVEAAYFPAELRLFDRADVTTATLLLRRASNQTGIVSVHAYESASKPPKVYRLPVRELGLRRNQYVVPISFGLGVFDIFSKFESLPTLAEMESNAQNGLWAGREVDETRISDWFTAEGGAPFLKGRMIDRFAILEIPQHRLVQSHYANIHSINFERIAWRDVSRPNQRRRLIATVIPSGWITGNSLGVAYFRDGNAQRLRALLGLMSSLPFELQLRARLATGHVSLSSLRSVRVPSIDQSPGMLLLTDQVAAALQGIEGAQQLIEAAAAHVYGLSKSQLERIMSEFPKLETQEKSAILQAYERIEAELAVDSATDPAVAPPQGIPNHYSAKLSDLDVQTAQAVPPGGNWKNVPKRIPLKRLQTIRDSFARGEGSRSTYYGRLRPDRPSYTINTYFSRPGNGCHLHYDYDGGQHRVISQREAARLQTFPDSFEFRGSKTSINQQIGNAVPPVLAYRIAKQLPGPGCFIDLFAGAGGLGLGFSWASWKPLVANEIEEQFLETYVANVHSEVVHGDIRSEEISGEIVHRAKRLRAQVGAMPLWILGGPPCQGFSTAGKRRSIDDERNHLFRDYIHLLKVLKPDGFVFENVTGLLNMEQGSVFRDLSAAFRPLAKAFGYWILDTEEHAIPQRRTRVVLIGMQTGDRAPVQPPPITGVPDKSNLFGGSAPWVTAHEALSDLPPLSHGQDGSRLPYASAPMNSFQAFMRGMIDAGLYLDRVATGRRGWP